jgi:hypothetical protein
MYSATTFLSGLNQVKGNSFRVSGITSAAFVRIAAPSFSVNKISVIQPSVQYPMTYIRLFCAAGTVPSWAVAGAGVTVNVVVPDGNTINSLPATVVSFDTVAGLYIDCYVTDSNITATNYNQYTLTSGTVTLITQCQKAIISTPSGNTDVVSLADSADFSGASQGWSQDIPAGSSGYDLSFVNGTKFDVTDFYLKSGSGSQTALIRFF